MIIVALVTRIRALSEARGRFGLSDRTITVLEALLSFHAERELDGAAPIVVFPSNAELSLRSRGMADATLRRHLAALVEAGLVLRRDSPNGKRYALRGRSGEVESAFGFDLAPLALAAPQIHAAAEEARALANVCRRLRGEITIHLRDVAKIVEAGLAENRAGDWQRYALALVPLSRRIGRQAAREALEARVGDLIRLRAQVESAYLDSLQEQEMSANDANSERHYQNSNTEPHSEKCQEKERKPAPVAEADRGELTPVNHGGPEGPTETKMEPVALGYVLAVCPTIASYARDGISDWRDLLGTAGLVRSMLGVSPDAWEKARAAKGEMAAAAAVAAMLERAEAIRSPGGYLWALTERAENGRFSVKPMLAALETARMR